MDTVIMLDICGWFGFGTHVVSWWMFGVFGVVRSGFFCSFEFLLFFLVFGAGSVHEGAPEQVHCSMAAVHGIILAGCIGVVHCAKLQRSVQRRCIICIRVKEVQTSCAVLRAAGGFAGHLVTEGFAAFQTRESMS
jgi:hypothetical protein